MRIVITRRAVERYQERIKPALSFGQAREELAALLRLGVEVQRPHWYGSELDKAEISRYFELAPDLVGVVEGRALVTIIQRQEISPAVRTARNAYKARKRRKKRMRRQNEAGRGNGRSPARVESEAWPV